MTSSAHPDDVANRPPSEPAMSATPAVPKPEAAPAGPDIERLATNAARFIEQSGKAVAAYLKPFESGTAGRNDISDTMAVALTAIGKVAEHWMSDPARLAEAQSAISTPFLQLWAQTLRRMRGEAVEPVIVTRHGCREPDIEEASAFQQRDQGGGIA